MEVFGWFGPKFHVGYSLILAVSLHDLPLTPLRYINFAHGDEAQEVVYGDSLARLQSLKQRIDPDNWFNQWFDINPSP